MNYELAKQLQDAGFPMICNGDTRYLSVKGDFTMIYRIDDQGNYHGINNSYIGPYKEDFVPLPTLSELIEACENSLFGLSRMKNGTRTKWYCLYNYSLFDSSIRETPEYTTPEEAVANLWLELNKNNHDTK